MKVVCVYFIHQYYYQTMPSRQWISVVPPLNFSFLPHILQQCLLSNCCFFVFKYILLFVAATIPSRQALQTTYLTREYLCYSLIMPFLRYDRFNLLKIVCSRSNGTYLELKGFIHLWFILWINLLF